MRVILWRPSPTVGCARKRFPASDSEPRLLVAPQSPSEGMRKAQGAGGVGGYVHLRSVLNAGMGTGSTITFRRACALVSSALSVPRLQSQILLKEIAARVSRRGPVEVSGVRLYPGQTRTQMTPQ